MAFDAHGSRLRALERHFVGTGPVLAVITGSMSAEEIAAAERAVAEAQARGKDTVVVRILFDAKNAPAPAGDRACQGSEASRPMSCSGAY